MEVNEPAEGQEGEGGRLLLPATWELLELAGGWSGPVWFDAPVSGQSLLWRATLIEEAKSPGFWILLPSANLRSGYFQVYKVVQVAHVQTQKISLDLNDPAAFERAKFVVARRLGVDEEDLRGGVLFMRLPDESGGFVLYSSFVKDHGAFRVFFDADTDWSRRKFLQRKFGALPVPGLLKFAGDPRKAFLTIAKHVLSPSFKFLGPFDPRVSEWTCGDEE